MGSWGDDIGLLYLVLLNAAVAWAAWRLARRRSADVLDAAGDAVLLYYLVQYVSVCIPGLVGALHPLTIGLVALLASVFMALGSWRIKPREQSDAPLALRSTQPITRRSRIVAAAALMFVIGYLAALVHFYRSAPVLANDAITYHLPAAVQWLQTGRLGVYETWYYNPANSYSPLAGSVFLAWLIAPVQGDVVARFAAVGPTVMLLVALMNLCRRLGADAGVAALLAAACVLARPFVSQAVLAKDDLFVAAFFVTLVDALARERLVTRSGPWRAGIALGLLLATKYTALLSLPVLLLLASRAWTFKRLLIAFLVAFVLAGPWYLRNVKHFGNPLYPSDVAVAGVTLVGGMMHVTRSDLLKTPHGAWQVFVGGYYGLTRPIAIVLVAAWLAAAVVLLARARRDGLGALQRTCLFGPTVGIATFVLVAPYGEMRFAYPSLALLFAAAAIALMRLPWIAQVLAAAAFAVFAALTAFRVEMSTAFAVAGGVLAALAMLAAATRRAKRVVVAAGAAAACATTLFAYVYWKSYVADLESDHVEPRPYPAVYGPIGDLWSFVRTELPRGSTIAYANTYFTYPLMGYRYDHRVVHAPTRRDVERFRDLPHLPRKTTGENLPREIVDMMRQNPDREAWLRRLRETGAQYLVIALDDPAEPARKITPPELTFAAEQPQRFVEAFRNEAGVVFRIVW